MPKINGQSLLLIIQAVDAEITRLRNLPDDEVRLVDFENLAQELEEKYEEAHTIAGNLPDYARLVGRSI